MLREKAISGVEIQGSGKMRVSVARAGSGCKLIKISTHSVRYRGRRGSLDCSRSDQERKSLSGCFNTVAGVFGSHGVPDCTSLDN